MSGAIFVMRREWVNSLKEGTWGGRATGGTTGGGGGGEVKILRQRKAGAVKGKEKFSEKLRKDGYLAGVELSGSNVGRKGGAWAKVLSRGWLEKDMLE